MTGTRRAAGPARRLLLVAAVVVGATALLSSCTSAVGGPAATSEPRPHRSRAAAPRAPATGDGARQVPAVSLDPATLPTRPVEQALLAATLFDTEAGRRLLVVVDAATGEWVRPDVPEPVAQSVGVLPLLAPDGRSFVQTTWVTDHVEVEVVDLRTGSVRKVPVVLPDDCVVDSVAWAPDAQHLGVVTYCSTPNEYPTEPTGWVVVEEVAIGTGAFRLVEHVSDAVPVETYPSYSPDGKLFAYGIAHPSDSTDDDEVWASARVVGTRGGVDTHEWSMTHMVYGDPWRDAQTLLGWDENASVTGPDSHALLSVTGSKEQYGFDGATNLDGFVGGALVGEVPGLCPAALCTIDLDTHAVAPWLTLPDGVLPGSISPARALLGG
ncbi:hypothetical protein Cch01nite_28100 [Cellulomonas chitinilytica]|uniref:Lipoprotein LpqB beta-propeller domain-containing protein n=1 Tax=Cellulomonas chitinilytica TaxID=398759 RepID=A0A919U275_9CELL|nr:hypothetical protein [Cellulomonas chitinilytica]GIG22086.1 hypothetical protein Cch01nite_28100 [Cellulomonas chitinilytica]